MNEKINTNLAIAIIVIIAGLAGSAIFINGKKQNQGIKSDTTQSAKKGAEKNTPAITPKNDEPIKDDQTKNNTSSCDGISQITDPRDAKNPIYQTVAIGTQCWLNRNLNVGTMLNSAKNQTDNKIFEKYCSSNSETKCALDGGFYQWNEAMQYAKTENAQGICPSGWHIPSDNDWVILENYLTDAGQTCDKTRVKWDCAAAGDKLKQDGASGFNAIFTGYRALYGKFFASDRGTLTHFWSSTQSYPESEWDSANPGAWSRQLYFENSTIQRDHYQRVVGFSIRCLKD